MKKALILLGLLAIFLVGCESSYNPAEEMNLPISITAKVDGGNCFFTADITADYCRISFNEGDASCGKVLEFNGETGTAVIGDFTREVTLDIFPAQDALVRALRGINAPKTQAVETEKGFKYTIDEMTIMVYYDKSAERIIGIGTEEDGRRFDFDIAALMPYEEPSNGVCEP